MAKITLTEFKKHYFYKTDLIKLCHEYRLPTYGTKAELNHYLYLYLTGTPASKIKPYRTIQKKAPLTADEITLDTKIIDFGISFKKEMAIIKRQAKADNNTSMTVNDLIKQSMLLKNNSAEKLNIIAKTPEETTYQWNTFVKDFCQGPESNNFTDKLKVAAILWQNVKKSDQPKKYSNELIQKYTSKISGFRKSANNR